MTENVVSGGERGVIRVFALDGDPRDLSAADVAMALGVDRLDPQGVEIVAVRDLSEIGLSGYLTEGLGVAAGEVSEEDFAGVGPAAVILRSVAFEGAATLTPRAPLRFIGAWREAEAPLADLSPMDAVSAHPVGSLEPPLVPAPKVVAGRSWAVLTGFALAILVVVLAVVILGGAP